MSETVIEFGDNRLVQHLCGPHNRHLAVIEAAFDVTLSQAGAIIRVLGDEASQADAADALRTLYDRLASGKHVDAGVVDGVVRLLRAPQARAEMAAPQDAAMDATIRTSKKTVEPRTPGQIDYIKALKRHELAFGVGPAGTGKTYLAVAYAVSLYLEGVVDKLILSRPAVEAGERLGFLPGTEKEKVDPYLRPLYDAIYDLWAGAKVDKLIEEGKIEVAPLAFMRGRTLSNAFVVLDEAQNTTEMQMRMFLTRLGENSRMVVTGDPSQIDLPRGVRSGLVEALYALDGVEGVSITRLTDSDVVRHPLVARIVRAYAALDAEP